MRKDKGVVKVFGPELQGELAIHVGYSTTMYLVAYGINKNAGKNYRFVVCKA